MFAKKSKGIDVNFKKIKKEIRSFNSRILSLTHQFFSVLAQILTEMFIQQNKIIDADFGKISKEIMEIKGEIAGIKNEISSCYSRISNLEGKDRTMQNANSSPYGEIIQEQQ